MALQSAAARSARRLRHISSLTDASSLIHNYIPASSSFNCTRQCSSYSSSSSSSSPGYGRKLPSPPVSPSPSQTHPKSPPPLESTVSTQSSISSLLRRLVSPDGSGESPVLRLLGYYSSESKAVGAANLLYSQARTRAHDTVNRSLPAQLSSEFVPHFELLSVHMYLTLRRLRAESGSPFEADVKMAMQSMFDSFWNDVRFRMMMKDHGLSLLQSGKWVKQCEKNFFAMALEFDELLTDTAVRTASKNADDKLITAINKHISSIRDNSHMVNALLNYMKVEKRRLDKLSVEEIWSGRCWDTSVKPLLK